MKRKREVYVLTFGWEHTPLGNWNRHQNIDTRIIRLTSKSSISAAYITLHNRYLYVVDFELLKCHQFHSEMDEICSQEIASDQIVVLMAFGNCKNNFENENALISKEGLQFFLSFHSFLFHLHIYCQQHTCVMVRSEM